MRHDKELLDRLSAHAPIRYDGEVFRATRQGLDPLAASVSGGRWMFADATPTLYTSCERNGALAEIAHHWNQWTPPPSKSAVIHTLGLRTGKVLKLGRFELVELGVDWDQYGMSNSHQTQAIGAAVAHLEYDGLIAPSARWQCDNVMLFVTKQSSCEDYLVVRHSIEVDWRVWAAENAR